jgi:Raf kinase inhibitor-like YbhB/YbcL family protein
MPATSDISEGSVPGIQGRNSSGALTYVGPCPASGEHRYVFKVYAVKDKLKFNKKPLKADVEATAAEQLIATAEFTAVYKKK